jgi:hypothetical protein
MADGFSVSLLPNTASHQPGPTGFTTGTPDDGILNNQLQDFVSGSNSTKFTFADPIRAFGADFNLLGPGGEGVGIQVAIDGMVLGQEILNTTGNANSLVAAGTGFFGFINPDLFTMVTLTAASQASQTIPGADKETYSMDNVAFSPVPEPSAVLVFGTGLIVTGLAIRQRPR